MDEGFSFKTLAEKYDKTQQELNDIENNLRCLLRVRPNCSFPESRRYENKSDLHVEKHEALNTFQDKELDELPPVENEDSDDCDYSAQNHGLRSAVVKNTWKQNRKDAINKQNLDGKITSRNRRILGMLQCTLQKFKNEAVKNKLQDMKRIEIEQKIEAAQVLEKEKIKQQIKELHGATKQKQYQLERLAEMMDLVQLHELWKENQSYLLNFMMTKAEPKICFLPTHHTQISKKIHNESKMKILETIKQHEAKLKEELIKYENFCSASVIDEDDRLHCKYSVSDEKDNTSSFLVSKALKNGYTSCPKKRKMCGEVNTCILPEEELIFD